MASRAELQAYRELARIGDARLQVARGKLAEAERTFGQCGEAVHQAEKRTGQAFEAWAASIGSALLGPVAVKAAAGDLLAAESGLVGAKKQLQAATREADEAALALRAAEARARAERERTQKLARKHRLQAEERAQDQIAELILGRRSIAR